VIREGIHWADGLFLLVVIGAVGIVDPPIYVGLPVVLVAASVWKHVREWLGIADTVRADAIRRGRHRVGPKR
jgi:hypothetical protein